VAFGVRSVIPNAPSGLRQSVARFSLAPPANLRTLSANVAIAAKYDLLGGFKGPLGVSITSVGAADQGSFAQSFRGGDLRFTADGTTIQDKAIQLQASFQGIHCFGNPGFGKSDSVYAIVVLYGIEQAALQTLNLPSDGSGGNPDHWDDLEQGQDRTEGQGSLVPVDAPTPPQPVHLSAKLMRCGATGECHSSDTKKAVIAACAGLGSVGGFPIGGLAGAGVGAAVGAAVGKAIADLFGLSDAEIGTWNRTFTTVEELLQLPPQNSLRRGPITFNVASDLITDGDASYSMHFNLHVLATTELQPPH